MLAQVPAAPLLIPLGEVSLLRGPCCLGIACIKRGLAFIWGNSSFSSTAVTQAHLLHCTPLSLFPSALSYKSGHHSLLKIPQRLATRPREEADLHKLRIPMIWPLFAPCIPILPQILHILHSSAITLSRPVKHILVSHDSEPLFASTSQSFWNTIPQPIPAYTQAFVFPPHSGYLLLKVVPGSLCPPPSSDLHTAWLPNSYIAERIDHWPISP